MRFKVKISTCKARHVAQCVFTSHIHFKCVLLFEQFVFKTEAHGFRTVHEELTKGMNSELKSNEQSAVRNILKVRPQRRPNSPCRTRAQTESIAFFCFCPFTVFLVLSGNHSEVHGAAPGRFREAESKLASFT